MVNLGTTRKILFSALLLLLAEVILTGQSYNYFYRVYFTDKGSNPSYTPSQLFSQAAIDRRIKNGIPYPDYSDLPVYNGYINEIRSMGMVLHSTSKWMNTALFKTQDLFSLNVISELPFVRDVQIVKNAGVKKASENKLSIRETLSSAAYDLPVTMLNGQVLHKAGFKGEGMLIAVLDAGFVEADQVESLSLLRSRGGIIATRDFVNKKTGVYDANTHGTAVLSILAGDLEGFISGTAPHADYILLKTEDDESEFPCEEDMWAAGAEYADSAGAVIISSSLGYFSFDDPSMNYSHDDLDGNTSFITKAADMAAKKGILVVNSAGNERDNSWEKIIMPADGDSVLATGAVDERKMISGFSSAGPSADGRIKPDVSAMGVTVPLQTSRGYITAGSGTSFSCPVISGMAACMMQAIPEANNWDIIAAFQASSHLYNTPDSLYGFGIPDMSKAAAVLRQKYLPGNVDGIFIFPNPTTGRFRIIFESNPSKMTLEIFSSSGKMLSSREYALQTRTAEINVLENMPDGIYFLRIITQNGTFKNKIVRIRR